MKGLAGSRTRLRSSVARVRRWSGVREHHVVCSTVRRPRSCLSPRPCRTAFTPIPPGVQQLLATSHYEPSRWSPAPPSTAVPSCERTGGAIARGHTHLPSSLDVSPCVRGPLW